MSLFSQEVFVKEVRALAPTQEKIKTLALYMKTLSCSSTKMVQILDKEFKMSNSLHKLNILYLANELIINIKKSDTEMTLLRDQMRTFVLTHFSSTKSQMIGHPALKSKLNDLKSIWIDRKIFTHQSILHQCTMKTPYESNEKVSVPDFFPKKPIHIFDGPDVYSKLDIDTLFFIFYFSKDENQVFSARELKKYSWRYHTKYNTWFQRLEEPKLITEYYEQGVFLFFDFEVTWTNRKKKDFTFEYKYLENIEM